MRYFTDSPFERMMMDTNRKGSSKDDLPPDEQCIDCKFRGEPCVYPCSKRKSRIIQEEEEVLSRNL